jgi:hypothetical protein
VKVDLFSVAELLDGLGKLAAQPELGRHVTRQRRHVVLSQLGVAHNMQAL